MHLDQNVHYQTGRTNWLLIHSQRYKSKNKSRTDIKNTSHWEPCWLAVPELTKKHMKPDDHLVLKLGQDYSILL